MRRLIIFANGILPELESARRLIQAGDVLIAADGGTRHILALGLVPSIVIGDLDSLKQDDRRRLDAKGVEIQQYSHNKDETDLELAFQYAHRAGYREILVVGAQGGRLDQTVGNLSLLTNPEFATLEIRFDDGVEEAFITRGRCEVHGRPSDIVSLIPWSGEVTGISTEGLRWPLRDETLFPDKTRGISNELVRETAFISHRSGFLLVIHHRQAESSQ
ncbi:MAG: thiamine diphosphokinase [Anaerolineales bacterium]|jgi:thiamine pyrophosphokinase